MCSNKIILRGAWKYQKIRQPTYKEETKKRSHLGDKAKNISHKTTKETSQQYPTVIRPNAPWGKPEHTWATNETFADESSLQNPNTAQLDLRRS